MDGRKRALALLATLATLLGSTAHGQVTVSHSNLPQSERRTDSYFAEETTPPVQAAIPVSHTARLPESVAHPGTTASSVFVASDYFAEGDGCASASGGTCQCQGCQCSACPSSGCRHRCPPRTQLTGDWGGMRTRLAEGGFAYKATVAQFYQGVASGGNEQIFRYGNKFDQFFLFDSGKLGLWEGGKLMVHAETQLGQNPLLDAAALSPVNTVMLFPLPDQTRTAITDVQFEQALGGGYAAAFGKFNFVTLWEMLYPGTFGSGLDGFMNTSVIAPLNVIPTLPTVFNGAGLLKAGERGLEGGVMAIDPRNTQTVSGIPGLYGNGVTIFGFARKFVDVGGLPGSHLVAGTYATGDYTSLDRQGWRFVPDLGLVPGTDKGSWLAAYVLDQKLWVDRCNEKRNIGLFGMTGFSDPESSPYEWTMNASIQAFGLIQGREGDRAGIGYFYQRLSGNFKSLPGRFLPLQNMQGGEVYYNAEITPWFHVTADLQVIDPAVVANDPAIVVGLRAKIDL